MKTIQPVTIWYNGQEKQATILACYANSDNLVNSASFFYQLIALKEVGGVGSENNMVLSSGSLTMDGEVYQNWQTNEYAYDWVAQKLNITITGDYTPPQPESSEYKRENIENL